MSFRNWLLTGTSAIVLALAPVGAARAQDASDPALQAAYQAYQAEESDANRDALREACIAAGFSSLDDCLAALGSATEQAAPPPPPPSSEEAPPPPPPSSEEPPPPPPPSSEEPPPPPPSSEEPPPPPPVSSEEPPPPPSSEEAPPPPPPSSEEPPPPPVSSEEPPPPPPPSSEEAAPPPPSSEAPPPPPSSSEQGDVLVQLQAAVDLYNEGVADLAAGNAGGQAKIDQASAQIDTICTAAGQPDRTACLAQFGLELNPLPAAPPPSSEQPAPPPGAPSSEPPAGGPPGQPPAGGPGGQPPAGPPPGDASSSEQPISELPGANAPVDQNAVEPLPPDVAAEAAPVLDSQKPAPGAGGPSGPGGPGQPPAGGPGGPGGPPAGSSSQPPPDQPPAPPPTTDQAAQQNIQPPPPADQSATTEQGTRNDRDFFRPPPPQAPDVRVVDQPRGDSGAIVFQIGINLYIRNVEQERDRYYNPREDEIYYEDLPGGRTREVVERPNGVRIVTVYDRDGDVLKRTKILPDGREYYLASYDRDDDEDEDDDGGRRYRDPGDDLPPLRLTIPVREYILDADVADEDEVEEFLDQPPVEEVRRIYSIDEVKRSARLRDSVRRLEIGGLTFDSGRATIARDQVDELSEVANAMLRLLERNPAEVFLIEGHTDTVGADVSNLVLSDERAATVARVLTDFYEVPAENLVTQGYGERYLKVQVEGDEPENRRVTVKRITPLVTYEASN